ncbi:MAG TPA: glycosyltransferase family 39 protein [Steroidobacteraceae bacterium]|nr:glycosyltransferase family 39 protein [Steroidobacteraceae bacterium]
MKRYLAAARVPFLQSMVPLADVALFCVLISNGATLRAANAASFTVAMALSYLLKARSGDWQVGRRLAVMAVAAVMALFLRAGVLCLLSASWGWPAQLSIVFAVIAGMAVTTLGYSYAASAAEPAARARTLAIGLVVYACVLRLVYLGSVELLPEETYYWNYSRHLDIGYLDHPPMVAWLIRLGTAAFGQSEFGVRSGAFVCGVIASFFAYRLTRNLFGEASALAALVLAQILPFFFLSGLLMTPDAPLTAAWAASLYFLERALVAGRSGAWWGAGLCLGLGMLSKYSIGLLIPVTLAFMLWDRQARRWWLRWEPYAAALLALAIFSPVILWNAQHEWASFTFQTVRRLGEAPKFALHRLIASALVLITPTGVLAVAAALMGAKSAGANQPAGANPPAGAVDAESSRRWRFLSLAVLIPLAVFTVYSLRHEVKLDWTGAPWTAALPVMATGMMAAMGMIAAAGTADSRPSGLRAWLRGAWTPTLLTLLLLYGAGLHYLVLGLPGVGYSKHIELVPVGWRDLSRRVGETAAALRAETGGEPLIVGMDRYAIASEVAFYGLQRARSEVPTSSVNLFEGMGLMYERWMPARLQDGRTLLLVAWDPMDLTGKIVESRAERLGPIVDEVLMRDGRVVCHYYHRFAYNYRSIPRS